MCDVPGSVPRRYARSLAEIVVLLSACTSAAGQSPTVEVCEDSIQPIVGPGIDGGVMTPSGGITSTPVELEVDIEVEITLADVQLYLNWRSEDGFEQHSRDLTLTSPQGTTVDLLPGVGYPPGGLRSPHFYDMSCVLSDHGVEFGYTPWECNCLVQPPGASNPFAAFARESSKGVWVLEAALNTGGAQRTRLVRWSLRLFEAVRPLSVGDLNCETVDQAVSITWTNVVDYDAVEIYINAEFDGTLPGPVLAGTSETYVTSDLSAPQYATIEVVPVVDALGDGHPARCRAAIVGDPVLEECVRPGEIYYLGSPIESVLAIDADIVINDIQVELVVDAGLGPSVSLIRLESPTGTTIDLVRYCDEGEAFPCGAWRVPDVDIDRRDIRTTFWCLGRPFGPFFELWEHMQPTGPGALRAYLHNWFSCSMQSVTPVSSPGDSCTRSATSCGAG